MVTIPLSVFASSSILILFLFCLSSVGATQTYLEENSTWQGNLTAVRFSAVAFGDLNNDSRQDLVLSGCAAGACDNATTKIYINNGTTLEENSTWGQDLLGLGWSSLALGDIDNDGDLDLALCGCNYSSDVLFCDGDRFSRIYINNGTTLLENSTWQSNLIAVGECSLELRDIDNDGDLDLVNVGRSMSAIISKIYVNNGTSFVESSVWQGNLTGVYEGDIDLGDIDNDGDLDLAITGDKGDSTDYSQIYINDGTSLLENSPWKDNLLVVDRSSIILGDIDNDGDLDLDLIGQHAGDYQIIYKNSGSGFIQNQTSDDGYISGLFRGSLAFGDYTNDGYLDLVAIGKEGGRDKVYENNNTVFVIDPTASIELQIDNIQQGALTWTDIDNDCDLDLIVTGIDDTQAILVSKIYINNNTLPNSEPQPPNSSFSAVYSAGSVVFGWYNGSDNETPTAGLYYNLRIGTASNKNAVVTGVYGGSSGGSGGGGGSSGYFGNMMQRKNITITRNWEANTTYFWSVQTIDTALASGNWSEEQNFTTPLDTGLPEITLVAPADSYYSGNASVLFNASVVDANGIANVSLWANFNGTFMINETNSSGLNNTYYFFSRNLSQGSYLWMVQAYDNSSVFNYANSSARTVHVDLDWPQINLISPVNGSSWTSSSTVTFSYNVSDFSIANCSLVINNIIDQTETSVAVNTTMTFSKSLANGNYNWSVNCTDNINRVNSSGGFSLTVSYTAPSNGGGSTSGGSISGGATPVQNLTNISEIEEKEIEEPVVEEEKVEERKGFAEFFDKARVYFIVTGIVVVVAVIYFVYLHRFVKWNKLKTRKIRRIKW